VKGGQDGRATYAVDVYGREDLSDRDERGGQLQSLEKEKGGEGKEEPCRSREMRSQLIVVSQHAARQRTYCERSASAVNQCSQRNGMSETRSTRAGALECDLDKRSGGITTSEHSTTWSLARRV
jgi:hypothetical protein